MIRDLSVVEDPVRTTFGAAGDSRQGIWTFKHLTEGLAASADQAPDMVEAMFKTFTVTQTVNSFAIAPRPGFQTLLDNWPRSNGKLDLEQAPLRLLAIVNRIDLRDLDVGHAGEGRFIFGFLDPIAGFPQQATMILEYHEPATTEADVLARASGWHALGGMTFPSEDYNAALQTITESFAGAGAPSAKPSAGTFLRPRTNEIDLGGGALWELREFHLDAPGALTPAPIDLTPDRPSFDGTATLASFINADEATILTETHVVPLLFDGAPFLAGAVFNDLSGWNASGINNPDAREKLSINTCNGCHSATETNTFFLQVNPRSPGQESFLSPFLSGTTVVDPFSGQVRAFNDLARRSHDLATLVCPPDEVPPLPPPPPVFGDAGVMLPPPPVPAPTEPTPTVRKGISCSD